MCNSPTLFPLALASLLLGCALHGAETQPPIKTKATYVLSTGDLLELKVYQEEDLTAKFRIARDATSNLPLIGNVSVGGKTVEEAIREIEELYNKDYLVNPQVTLTVLEHSKRRFTVLGQVQKPGAYEISTEQPVTLLQAIAMAGGYTRLANQSKVTVLRTVDGEKIPVVIDVRKAAKNASSAPFLIQAEDTITVPERVF